MSVKYGDVEVIPQYPVIRFLWAKGLNANKIHSEMCSVYDDNWCTKPVIHVWCTLKFDRSRESIVDKERPGGHCCGDQCHDCHLPQLVLSYGPTGQSKTLFSTPVFHEIQCTEWSTIISSFSLVPMLFITCELL